MNNACRKNYESVKENLSSIKLANILSAMITEHAVPQVNGKSYPEAPNQQWETITSLLKLVVAVPEVYEKEQWIEFIGKKILMYIENGSQLLDGSDKEQSFNYNTALLDGAARVVKIIDQMDEKTKRYKQ